MVVIWLILGTQCWLKSKGFCFEIVVLDQAKKSIHDQVFSKDDPVTHDATL